MINGHAPHAAGTHASFPPCCFRIVTTCDLLVTTGASLQAHSVITCCHKVWYIECTSYMLNVQCNLRRSFLHASDIGTTVRAAKQRLLLLMRAQAFS